MPSLKCLCIGLQVSPLELTCEPHVPQEAMWSPMRGGRRDVSINQSFNCRVHHLPKHPCSMFRSYLSSVQRKGSSYNRDGQGSYCPLFSDAAVYGLLSWRNVVQWKKTKVLQGWVVVAALLCSLCVWLLSLVGKKVKTCDYLKFHIAVLKI